MVKIEEKYGNYLDCVEWFINSTLEDALDEHVARCKKYGVNPQHIEKIYLKSMDYVSRLVKIASTTDFSSLYKD